MLYCTCPSSAARRASGAPSRTRTGRSNCSRPFSSVPVAIRALIVVNLLCCHKIGLGRAQGVLAFLVRDGHHPRRTVKYGQPYGNANQNEYTRQQGLAQVAPSFGILPRHPRSLAHPRPARKQSTQNKNMNQVPRKISHNNSPLKNSIAADTTQATAVVSLEFTNEPILLPMLVNCTRGITANGN